MASLYKELDSTARLIVGFPYCTCGMYPYDIKKYDGWDYAVFRTWAKRNKINKWCRHRTVRRSLIRIYRLGRKHSLTTDSSITTSQT